MTKFWLLFSVILLSATCSAKQLAVNKPQRIISLAPHTTELVFALGAGERLVAVSDYSDYPSAAKALPSVASFQGVNFEQIVRLQPDLIVAWQGGNKPQDLTRLASLGYPMYYSSPENPEAIAEEIITLGARLGHSAQASALSKTMLAQLTEIRQKYAKKTPTTVFYYMSANPLMTVGGKAWASNLVTYCGAKNIFSDTIVAYPEVSLEQVLSKQPQFLIAAMKTQVNIAETHWSSVRTLIHAPLITVNPDLLHRFTPRLVDGLREMCEKLN